MRNAITLIELIFSMLIIAIVFTVVPKIIFASNKSMQLSKKEDALFNAYSMMGSVIKLVWDENTSNAGKILDTDAHTCNNYRVGGFKGSRNCIDSDDTASAIKKEDSDYNDIDDYNNDNSDVNSSIGNVYDLNITVRYTDKDHNGVTGTDELKEINVTVSPGSDNNKMKNFKSSFFYYSTNLGHIQIKKEKWK